MRVRVQKLSVIVLFSVTLLSCRGESGSDGRPTDQSALQIATVVKVSGINWFSRMEEGVRAFAAEKGVTAFQKGPERADGALQVQIIEDLIALGVDAMCVIPMSPEVLEPVLEKAMDAGIVVVTHEASNQVNRDFDIEAFDNAEFGRHLMDHLAARMGEEGAYAVFVGSLTSKTHNEWVDAAIAHQRESYPRMRWVGDKNESYDDARRAYDRARELLKAYPDLKGFQGSASPDVAGIGQAVEEAGLQDRVAVVGTSLPSIVGDLFETGAVDLISFWDPRLAGIACNEIAYGLLQGREPENGMNLGLTGYESLRRIDRILYGQAWVDVTRDNADQYPF